jgi:hypothetical protein
MVSYPATFLASECQIKLRGRPQYVRKVIRENIPLVKNLPMKRLVLAPSAIVRLLWRTNAKELISCINGKQLVLVSITAPSF